IYSVKPSYRQDAIRPHPFCFALTEVLLQVPSCVLEVLNPALPCYRKQKSAKEKKSFRRRGGAIRVFYKKCGSALGKIGIYFPSHKEASMILDKFELN